MTDLTPDAYGVAGCAMSLLREAVADKPYYTQAYLDELTRQFKDSCKRLNVDPKDVLAAAAHTLCVAQPGFEQRLQLRASQVEDITRVH